MEGWSLISGLGALERVGSAAQDRSGLSRQQASECQSSAPYRGLALACATPGCGPSRGVGRTAFSKGSLRGRQTLPPCSSGSSLIRPLLSQQVACHLYSARSTTCPSRALSLSDPGSITSRKKKCSVHVQRLKG